MGHLTFADLIARRVPLSASEAAALTLAVARLMDERRASVQRVRLPDDEWILLSSGGEVSMVAVHGSLECDETAALSALLRRLLRLDERLPAERHQIVPGGLLIVLARNLGYIHLPATSPAAFRAALERFATADPAVLSTVFWRAASCARDGRTGRPAAGRPSDDGTLRADRRQRGASAADLRRALRDLERELFELRGRLTAAGARVRPAFTLRRTAAAAALAACFVGALAVAALALTTGSGTPALAARTDIPLVPAAAAAAPTPNTRVLQAQESQGPEPLERSERFEQPERFERPERSERSEGGLRRVSTSAQPTVKPEATRARPTRTDPFAAFRGGTRGIPFTLPSD
jgi:hypothetical protein